MKPSSLPEIRYGLTDFVSIAQSVAQQLNTDWNRNHYLVPDWLGEGKVEAYTFDAFSIMLSRFNLKSTTRISRFPIPTDDILAFDFIISGHSKEFTNDANKSVKQLKYGLYITTPRTKGSGIFDKNQQHDHLSILVNKTWLANFLNITLPQVLQATQERLTLYCNIKSYLMPTLSLLTKTTEHLTFRKQFFYSKGLEVITIVMAQFMEQEKFKAKVPYHPSDIKKAATIANYVQQNLHQRLTVEQLSQTFNINRDKLQQLFKAVYGKPIAAYIRYVKMSLAYKMLLEQQSVAEVGYALGYANLSHFSKAFKKIHGINPSEVK